MESNFYRLRTSCLTPLECVILRAEAKSRKTVNSDDIVEIYYYLSSLGLTTPPQDIEWYFKNYHITRSIRAIAKFLAFSLVIGLIHFLTK